MKITGITHNGLTVDGVPYNRTFIYLLWSL